MQTCYFLANFGFVLTYILKAYRKKFSFILLFNSLLAIFFWKACTFSSFEKFLCWKFRNYSHTFLSKSSFDIYLSQIINYWISFFTLYLTWGALTFQSDIVRIWADIKLLPFYYKPNALTTIVNSYTAVYSVNRNYLFSTAKQEKNCWNNSLIKSAVYLLMFSQDSMIFEGNPNLLSESYFTRELRLGES